MLKLVYNTFGLTYKMALSTRPQEKLGDDAMWDQAEGALQGALDESGLEWEVSPSEPPLHRFFSFVLVLLGIQRPCTMHSLLLQPLSI